jgi:hypothetical protein
VLHTDAARARTLGRHFVVGYSYEEVAALAETGLIAGVEALNAGADLLLVAYDGAQFYRIFACASAALEKATLEPARLRDSEARLRRAFPAD